MTKPLETRLFRSRRTLDRIRGSFIGKHDLFWKNSVYLCRRPLFSDAGPIPTSASRFDAPSCDVGLDGPPGKYQSLVLTWAWRARVGSMANVRSTGPTGCDRQEIEKARREPRVDQGVRPPYFYVGMQAPHFNGTVTRHLLLCGFRRWEAEDPVLLRLHVLLVDDETDTRQAVEASLARDPFFILRDCASGAEALTAAVAWRPDLVLMDVVMPDMDGPTVLARLRADKRTAPIPVVFLTARAEPMARRRLLALGAAGVLAKPFDPMTLANELRRFVAIEGVLSPARESFLRRLKADASALSACRAHMAQADSQIALKRIDEIAHSLAGAGGIYGFAGISCTSAALADAAQSGLAGRAAPIEVERALNRLLERIAVH